MKAMRIIVPLVALFFLGAVTAAFLGVRELSFAASLQLIPAVLSLSLVPLAVIAAVTLLFGRFFCRAMCPLGILQSIVNRIFHPKTAVRRVCTRLPETNAQRIVRWTVLAAAVVAFACGYGAWGGMVDPYAIFGRVLSLVPASDGEGAPLPTSLAVASVSVFAAILLSAVFCKGRIWCNWICPAGTAFNLAAKFAWKKDAVSSGCGNCRRCFPEHAAKPTQQAEGDGVTRRDAIRTMAAAAAAEKLTDGGFANVTKPGSPERETPVLPPGAGNAEAFYRKCISCQLCVQNCPMHCLVPSTSLSRFGQPKMDFREGYCHIQCTRCSEVCPTDAIAPLTKEEKRTAHVGYAVWNKNACLRQTEGVECVACERKCPAKAIHIVKGVPVVDKLACLGCGACEHVCPARPMPGIAVNGLVSQNWTSPAKNETAFMGPPSLLDATLAQVDREGGAW